MNNECERRNRWFGACNFEPRYNVTPPTEIPFELAASFDAGANIRALSKRQYVCDVCTRCGKVAKNHSPATDKGKAE